MNARSHRMALLPLALLVSFFGIFGTSCRSEGTAEKAGERMDEAARDTKRALEDAAD